MEDIQTYKYAQIHKHSCLNMYNYVCTKQVGMHVCTHDTHTLYIVHFAFEKEPVEVRNLRPITTILLRLYYRSCRPKMVSGFWSSVSFKIGAVTLFFFFLGGGRNREIRDTCIRADQISHVQSMVAKRGLTNRANIHTLKHSTPEFQSIQ